MNELIELLITIAPAVTGVLATVFSVLIAIHKLTTVISELKQTNEMKTLIDDLHTQSEENKQLKKLYEKLLIELTKIRPMGYTDDE